MTNERYGLHAVTGSPPTLLESELREQAGVLAARTETGLDAARAAAAVLARDDVDYLLIAARGTSDNAARYAQYLLGLDAHLPVALAAPWLYEGDSPPSLTHGAVLAISQSGRSPDIAAVVTAGRRQGRPTIAITNDDRSSLAAQADVVVPLLAGDERSVAATKTYLASLHAVVQIATVLSGQDSRRSWFERLPDLVATAVEEQLASRAQFDPLDGASLITVTGRGLQFPTAYETALKVRELSGTPAEAFSPPDLIHGPIAALGARGAFWLVSTEGHQRPDLSAFQRLRQGTSVAVVVSDDRELLAAADVAVTVPPRLPQWLAPFIAVIPGQTAALRLGELRGVDIDHPHGL